MAWLALALSVPPSRASGETDIARLTVAVHREAGTVYDVAADGAAGLCTAEGSTIACPARGPVTFRWGPDTAFELVGDTVVAPGGEGTAVVWASEASRAAERRQLVPDAAVTPEVVRELFVRTSDHPVPVPSAEMFDDLLGLADHPDPKVRREVVEALVPYWRHTASDPFPLGAPPVVPERMLVALADDPDVAVRRRLASRLRDLVAPGEPLSLEATTALLRLAAEGGGVQRAAFASLASRARDGRVPAVETWQAALDRVTAAGPPGRAAANTLAALASTLEPGGRVDPRAALELVIAHHPERAWVVWRAWRAHVPFEAGAAERLLRETVGLSPGLVRAWADDDPAGLARVLARWEPGPAHSDRFRAVARALASVEDPALRAAIGDNLSPEPRPAGQP